MKAWYPTLLFVLVVFAGRGQNLVPNGGFESYHVCPGSYSRTPAEFRVPSWKVLTTGSPDYFHQCSDGEAAVPYNWAGVSDAFEGKGYAGIYTWMGLKEYREYLHCRLAAPLMKDSLYQVQFRYKLASYSKYSIDRIAFLLSDSLKAVRHDRALALEPTVSFVKDSALTPETGSWEIATAEYRAAGGEQYLTIGNFDDDQTTRHYRIRFRPVQEPMLASAAYYYIDDVQVTPLFGLAPEDDEPQFFAEEDPRENTVYILRDIRFAFGSYQLMPVSHDELDRVVAYLRTHPEMNVRLIGHTDDVGSYEYNMMLSVNRARNAAEYLITQGIDDSRIVTLGYGESQPLIPDASAEAREKNRRVEIVFFR